MLSLLQIHFSGFDILVVISTVLIVPIIFITTLIIWAFQYYYKTSNKLITWQIILSFLLFIFSLIILLHQLQGNIREEAHLSIASSVFIIISILFFIFNIKKSIKLSNI